MNTLAEQIRMAQIRAAEKVVIASIPDNLMENMRRADAKFAAKGGCPGCGSKQVGVHILPCLVYNDSNDFY